MGTQLNTRRFLAAGLVAGLAINIFDGTLYTGVLAAEAEAMMVSLGLQQPSNAELSLFALNAFVMASRRCGCTWASGSGLDLAP